jgi:hypothetical protein
MGNRGLTAGIAPRDAARAEGCFETDVLRLD